MEFNQSTLIPYISASQYDQAAEEFLETYYEEALKRPIQVPILDIARNEMHLDVQFIYLSEELDVYGMTIFSDGAIDIYLPNEGIYESRVFKKKTILIDPEAYKKTNKGSVNNTIAHECFHWFKHRYYYKMQNCTMARAARYCKCYVNQLPTFSEEEIILEKQAVGVAPRILMPKGPFIEKAKEVGVKPGTSNLKAIAELSQFYNVSKQSVTIRLEECSLI